MYKGTTNYKLLEAYVAKVISYGTLIDYMFLGPRRKHCKKMFAGMFAFGKNDCRGALILKKIVCRGKFPLLQKNNGPSPKKSKTPIN